ILVVSLPNHKPEDDGVSVAGSKEASSEWRGYADERSAEPRKGADLSDKAKRKESEDPARRFARAVAVRRVRQTNHPMRHNHELILNTRFSAGSNAPGYTSCHCQRGSPQTAPTTGENK